MLYNLFEQPKNIWMFSSESLFHLVAFLVLQTQCHWKYELIYPPVLCICSWHEEMSLSTQSDNFLVLWVYQVRYTPAFALLGSEYFVLWILLLLHRIYKDSLMGDHQLFWTNLKIWDFLWRWFLKTEAIEYVGDVGWGRIHPDSWYSAHLFL